jgi:hypothetical protein
MWSNKALSRMGGMRSSGQQVLERLVAMLESEKEAAARLGISATLLKRFLNGSIPVPDQVLLKALDLLPQSERPEGPRRTKE